MARLSPRRPSPLFVLLSAAWATVPAAAAAAHGMADTGLPEPATLIVDAGLGRPSHACTVMEWGYDAVLLNTAVALSEDPVAMAGAFTDAVNAGRAARRAGAMTEQTAAQPSTPVLGTPFWHQE